MRAAVVAELRGRPDDAWNCRMKTGTQAGRFAALNEAAADAYPTHQTKPLHDILDES